MYIAGFVIPVPADRQDAYRKWAEHSAKLMKDHGCLEIVEAWEDNVPDGTHTDFRRAVAARPNERIVFTWQVWPDKATVMSVEEKMKTDESFTPPADLPFDQRRLIFGGFDPIFTMGR